MVMIMVMVTVTYMIMIMVTSRSRRGNDVSKNPFLLDPARSYHLLGLTKITCKNRFLGRHVSMKVTLFSLYSDVIYLTETKTDQTSEKI